MGTSIYILVPINTCAPRTHIFMHMGTFQMLGMPVIVYSNGVYSVLQWDGSLRKWEYQSLDEFEEGEVESSSNSDDNSDGFLRRSSHIRMKAHSKCKKRQRQESWCQNTDKKFRRLFD